MIMKDTNIGSDFQYKHIPEQGTNPFKEIIIYITCRTHAREIHQKDRGEANEQKQNVVYHSVWNHR